MISAPASRDQVLAACYAELDALLAEAIAACAAVDHAQALLLSSAAVQKIRALDGRLGARGLLD